MSSSSRRKSLSSFAKMNKLGLILNEEEDRRSKSPLSITSKTKTVDSADAETSSLRTISPAEEFDANPDQENPEAQQETVYSGFSQLINNTLKLDLYPSGIHFSIDLEKLKNVENGLDFNCLKNKKKGCDKFEVMRIDGYFGAVHNTLNKLLKEPPLDALAASTIYKVFFESLIELVPNASDSHAKVFNVMAEINNNRVKIVASDDGTGIQDKQIETAIQRKILATKNLWQNLKANNEIKKIIDTETHNENFSSLASNKADNKNQSGGAGLGLFSIIEKIYQHQGELSIYNKKEGHGLVLQFTSEATHEPSIEENLESLTIKRGLK